LEKKYNVVVKEVGWGVGWEWVGEKIFQSDGSGEVFFNSANRTQQQI
jgi:hypothetical protein